MADTVCILDLRMRYLMGRYINNIESHKNVRDINVIVETYLTDQGFKLTEHNDEQVWLREGLLTCPQFIKIKTIEKSLITVHIEAWLNVSDNPRSGYDDINPMTEQHPFLGFTRNRHISPMVTIADFKSKIYKLEVMLK